MRHVHFVTGKLAQHALRATVEELANQVGFRYSISVLPITVAALMTPHWMKRHLRVPDDADEVVIPGYCVGSTEELQGLAACPVTVGPRDLRELPEHFGRNRSSPPLDQYDIEIIAEINHAPRQSLGQTLAMARQLAHDGADVIDVGCDPGASWGEVGACVSMLKAEGFRVSIDSFNPVEVAAAVEAGAELVLSVNSSNRHGVDASECEVVVIPDDPKTLAGFDDTIEYLAKRNLRFRLDPILEPIGFGLGESLIRYCETRKRYPDAEMMMGIGNLTELTDCDSAGINMLLLSLCQEWRIHSVLTTQVINWARSSVRECDWARRLAHASVSTAVPPKRLSTALVMLRDDRLTEFGAPALDQLAADIRDHNYRIFAEDGEIHLLSNQLHLHDKDPYSLLDQLLTRRPNHLDASHAFYLGYEMSKAKTALLLGKNYEQDEALSWGFLTEEEPKHRSRRRRGDDGRTAER